MLPLPSPLRRRAPDTWCERQQTRTSRVGLEYQRQFFRMLPGLADEHAVGKLGPVDEHLELDFRGLRADLEAEAVRLADTVELELELAMIFGKPEQIRILGFLALGFLRF